MSRLAAKTQAAEPGFLFDAVVELVADAVRRQS